MALGYKARRRWALVILLVGLPAYIVACVTVLNWLDRPPILVELGVYVALGILWALPFRAIFRGIGQPDPDRPDPDRPNPDRPDANRPDANRPDIGPSDPDKPSGDDDLR